MRCVLGRPETSPQSAPSIVLLVALQDLIGVRRSVRPSPPWEGRGIPHLDDPPPTPAIATQLPPRVTCPAAPNPRPGAPEPRVEPRTSNSCPPVLAELAFCYFFFPLDRPRVSAFPSQSQPRPGLKSVLGGQRGPCRSRPPPDCLGRGLWQQDPQRALRPASIALIAHDLGLPIRLPANPGLYILPTHYRNVRRRSAPHSTVPRRTIRPRRSPKVPKSLRTGNRPGAPRRQRATPL